MQFQIHMHKSQCESNGYDRIFFIRLHPNFCRQNSISCKRVPWIKLIHEAFGWPIFQAKNLTRVHHVNLVSLIGYCLDENSMALVYEYMPEGTLQDKLRGTFQFLSIISQDFDIVINICILWMQITHGFLLGNKGFELHMNLH